MRESRMSGSVRGVLSNGYLYRDYRLGMVPTWCGTDLVALNRERRRSI